MIFGLGYIGMSLCELFIEAGFEVTGIDSDIAKVYSLNSSNESKIQPSEKELQRLKTRVLKIQHDLGEGLLSMSQLMTSI